MIVILNIDMTYCSCSRSSFNDVPYIIYTPKPQLSLMLEDVSCNHNMYEVIQTNFMATFLAIATVAISSVCFEMFETDEQRKMDNTRIISLGTF